MTVPTDAVLQILAKAKQLAQRYRTPTGKPLDIAGDVAGYEAARLLEVEPTPCRQVGYDAIERRGSRDVRLQINCRCILDWKRPGQCIGSIDISREFDAVLLLLLDADFEAAAIYEASRLYVLATLAAPGSKSRNERGALSLSKFKSIGAARWLCSSRSSEAAACPFLE